MARQASTKSSSPLYVTIAKRTLSKSVAYAYVFLAYSVVTFTIGIKNIGIMQTGGVAKFYCCKIFNGRRCSNQKCFVYCQVVSVIILINVIID